MLCSVSEGLTPSLRAVSVNLVSPRPTHRISSELVFRPLLSQATRDLRGTPLTNYFLRSVKFSEIQYLVSVVDVTVVLRQNAAQTQFLRSMSSSHFGTESFAPVFVQEHSCVGPLQTRVCEPPGSGLEICSVDLERESFGTSSCQRSVGFSIHAPHKVSWFLQLRWVGSESWRPCSDEFWPGVAILIL